MSSLNIVRDAVAARPIIYVLDSDPLTFVFKPDENADLYQILYRSDLPSTYFKTGTGPNDWTLSGLGFPASGCTNHPNAVGIAALMSNLVYWSNDLWEHCIFHEFAITNNPGFLARAQTLANPGAGVANCWPDYITGGYPGGAAGALVLAVKTRDLEQDIFNQMQLAAVYPAFAGFVGWLSQDVYAHCISEAQAFIDTINGKIWQPQELRDLWWEWNGEHAANGQSFIAPSAVASVNQSREFATQFFNQRAQMVAIGTGGNACSCDLDVAATATGVAYNSFLDGLHIGAPAPLAVPSTYITLVITHIKAETDAANAMIALLGCAP